MRKLISLFFICCCLNFSSAQDKINQNSDELLKEKIYKDSSVKVLNFSLKEFDQLFFQFLDKKAKPDLILTKEEFYGYTIQIAAFSDRLAVLYPDQKGTAAANKKKWFAERYEDYLLSKASHK